MKMNSYHFRTENNVRDLCLWFVCVYEIEGARPHRQFLSDHGCI